MRKKSFLMLIAVLVFSICLTMAFNITAFAADDVAEANPDVTVDIKDDVEETESESETKEKPQASETILEEEEDDQQIPGQDDADKILISDEKSPVSNPSEEPSEEPEEEKKEEPESLQDSENPAGELHYSVTISDLKGNSVDVTGGTEAVIADVLKDLGYQVAEDAIIEVDTESIDTEVITVTETENGPAIKDNGPFGKACKNLIVYVNGVAIELELVDPSTINGSQTTESLTKAFNGTSGTDVLNVKLTGNVTVTGTETINSIVLSKGTHDLYLESFTLTDNRTNKNDFLFTIGDGVILNVYCKEDSERTLGRVTGSSNLFMLVDSGILNYVVGSVSRGIDMDGDMSGKATQIAYIGSITEAPASSLLSGYYYLANDITANITIDSGKGVILDLNGYVLKGDGVTPSENSKNHSVITNNGVLTLIDSNPDAEHYFTYVDGDVWTLDSVKPAANVINLEDFTLDAVKDASAENVYHIKVSGGVITGGTGNYYLTDGFGVRYYGGGVYNTGTFTLNGGNITGNTVINNSNRSNNYGGGVYSTGTFIMNGGNISGNNVKTGGGGVHSTGTFTLNGGTVSGNTSSSAGGGVHSSGTFTMNGGTVSGNKSTSNGAGVNCAGGTFTMNGGEISGNETATNGGGVSCYGDSVFVMTGGKISGNKAPFNEQNPKYSGIGGGLAITGATATITGGTISGNTATKIGGGIYVAYTKNSLTVGGTAQITGNTLSSGEANNVYLAINTKVSPNKQHTVTISTETPLASGASIGITTESGACVFTGSNSANYSEYFFSDNSSYAVINEGSGNNQVLKLDNSIAKVVETGTTYATVQKAVDAIGATTSKTGTVIMLKDSTENVTIAAGQTITLDLNGHVLKGDGIAPTSDSQTHSVITNNGTLTLIDSNPSAVHSGAYATLPNGGVITGGTGKYAPSTSLSDGGGVYSTVSFTMKGGTVSGNNATQNGGGVYIAYGTFTLDGGTISGNTASNYGGGVYINTGILNIYNGTISGNIATKRGGGVYTNVNVITINMTGGTVTGNTATNNECGGGVYINTKSTFNITGGTISGNTSGGYGGGVCSYGSVNVGGKAVIQNNTTGTSTKVTNNLHLMNGYSKLITVLDGFNGNIGVTNGLTDDGTGTVTTASSTDYSAYFTSDKAGYGVHNSGKGDDQHVYIGNPVAQVEETMYLYETVQTAVDAIGAGTSAETTKSGTVKMLADSKENVTIKQYQNITLDLNGHVLKGDGTTSVIINDGKLTLNDSNPTTEHYFTYVKDGTWTLDSANPAAGANIINLDDFTLAGVEDASAEKVYHIKVLGGVITGGNSGNDYGGGVYNITYAEFTMNGGNITGNTTAFSGGGVGSLGTFKLTGGTISGNSSGCYGGGVTNQGSFTMENGIITGNTSAYAGGGVTNIAGTAIFTMIGGSITGNTASWFGGGLLNERIAIITGGTISGNSAANHGSGVYNNGVMTIGGTVVIKDNTGDNLYKTTYVTVAVSTEKPLTEGAEIWVTLETVTGDVTTASSTDYSGYFFSDNASYGVHNSGKDNDQHVYIGNPVAQVEETMYLYETVQTAVDAIGTGTVIMLKDANGDVTLGKDQVITLDLNGKIITGNIKVTDNGKLTVIDTTAKEDTDGFLKSKGGIDGSISADKDAQIQLITGLYSEKPYYEYVADGFWAYINRDPATMGRFPYIIYKFWPVLVIEHIDMDKLSDTMQNAINKLVTDGKLTLVDTFEAYMTIDGIRFDVTEGSTFTLYFGTELFEGYEASALHVWFIAEDGTCTEVQFTVNEKGEIVISGGMLGIYVITA